MTEPQLRNLPTLSALRAFEAAARLESFSAAAEELFVTHGAISHQIRGLEETLGLELFVRQGKRVHLSTLGAQYAIAIRQALADILSATTQLKQNKDTQRLAISVLPSFGARWLTPRLGRFIERYPEIEVVLFASHDLTNFVRENVDVGVRMGFGDWADVHIEALMEDTYFPVCSPNFNNGKIPHTAEQIAKSNILLDFGDYWQHWFASAGLSKIRIAKKAVLYQDSLLALRAAVEGQGVMLTRGVIAQEELSSGKLIKLTDIEIKSPEKYYFVCPPHALERKAVQAFRAWLFEEVATYQAEMQT